VEQVHCYHNIDLWSSDNMSLYIMIIGTTVSGGAFARRVARSHPFMVRYLDLARRALFFGSPASKPYRLSIGHFESDYFVEILLKGNSYRLKEADCR